MRKQQPPPPPQERETLDPRLELDGQCSRHFRFRDLIECGETWHRLTPSQRLGVLWPQQDQSWRNLQALAVHILDPLVDAFGPLVLTYGFAPPGLTRHIPGRIAPKLDQHAAAELRKDGKPICDRGGAAVDFYIAGRRANDLVGWMLGRLPVDRVYYFGDTRPLHVSWSPNPTQSVVDLKPGPSGRLIPRRRPR